MPERTSKPKRPRDINQLAHVIVQESIQEYPERDEPDDVNADAVQEKLEKNPHAQALGRLGGKKGGRARAEKLSAERRKEIARQAAEKRWGKKQ
jgi:cystathionine beta-lyase family protein involved in aluminum resistance